MRQQPWFILFAIVFGLAFAVQVEAQDPNYRLTATSGSGDVGDTVDIEFRLTNAEDITGYSFGVCNSDIVSIGGDSDITDESTVTDADFLFHVTSAEVNGWNVGAVLDVGPPQEVLAAGAGQHLYTVTYDLDTEGTALITFCDTVGDPPTLVSIADADGVEVSPVTLGGSIQVFGTAAFRFIASNALQPYSPDSEDPYTVEATISIEENPDNAGFPQDTQGFKLGLRHDPDVLTVTDVSVAPGSDLEDLNDGDGPIFFGPNLAPNEGDGFTLGCVYYFEVEAFLVFDIAKEVAVCTYDVEDSVLAGNDGGAQTTLEFDETLASPPVINAIVVDDVESDDVAGFSSLVTFVNTTITPFLRGDVNGDGSVDALVDAQAGLDWVFGDGDEPPCQDAMDVNDDGTISALVDMLSLLWWGFGDGAAPASPGTIVCGSDQTEDGITCLEAGDGCT